MVDPPPAPSLHARLVETIRRQGPMTVADYMARCLLDPAQGYYSRGPQFGRAGDFVTAPQISPMFAEILAAWLLEAWRVAGHPAPLQLVELGPGDGGLMAGILAAAAIRPAFLSAIEVVLVDPSAALRQHQAATLAPARAAGVRVRWTETVPDDPRPLLLIANEVLDALPIRQFVARIPPDPETPSRRSPVWVERRVGLDAQDKLIWTADPVPTPFAALLPTTDASATDITHGTVTEWSPARIALIDSIARALAARGGAALLIDYYLPLNHQGATGVTLQAVQRHRRVDPLQAPGEADLTSLVDLAPLRQAATEAGARVPLPMAQGAFLSACGLPQRASHLAADMPSQAAALASQVQRLCDPQAMGTLFQVLALAGPKWSLPVFDHG